ncbi:MAG: DUF1700 domain-containing protein [Ruminococcus sp.]|nr:DUF1700 domain-containing protein [Ruminococcus sp.]
MNKLEFLTTMRNRLEKFGLPQDEINDALSYYEEVFLDAGFGKEEATAEELGDPIEIADGILRDSGIHTSDASEYPPRFDETQVTGGQPVNNSTSNSNFWLKLIILILTFPIWLPIIVSVFAVLFALLISAIAIIAALIGSGIALIVGGIQLLFEAPPVGITCIGIGLMVTGLFIMVGKPFINRLIPASARLIRGTVNKIKGLFNRRGGNNNG